MSITIHPAHLSAYPSERPVAACRVDPKDYPTADGVCIKLGRIGISISWRRR